MENELDYLRQQVDAYDKRQQASDAELGKLREELKAVNDYNQQLVERLQATAQNTRQM